MEVNGNGPTRKDFRPTTEKQKAMESAYMLHLFRKNAVPRSIEKDVIPQGYTSPQCADELLSTGPRQKLIDMIWQRTSLSSPHFERLYLVPLKRFANLVQLLPASECHHHAYAGGMLDHGLEIIVYALKLRQSHLLPPGSAPEDQSAEADAWTAGLTYAALLHDIGKIIVDQHVQLASGLTWHAWNGPIGEPYRMRFVTGRDYHQHPAAGALIALQILTPDILDWLMETPALFRALTYVLSGHYDRAGILGELVIKADQASVSKALGGNPAKAIEAPKDSLQSKVIAGLRHLVKNELRLNQPGASGWLTNEALWLVSKSVTDQLKAYLLSQGFEGIPYRNSRLFDEMQSHGIIQPTPTNMAIWNCTIVDPERNWNQKLTMLKVAPALIWGTEDRPEIFSGTVEIVTDPATIKQATGDQPAEPQGSIPSGDMAALAPISKPPPHAEYDDDELTQLMNNFESQVQTSAHDLIEDYPQPALARDEDDYSSRHESTAPSSIAQPVMASADAQPQDFGAHFVGWLRSAIQRQALVLNDVKAKVHTVAGTAFLVTPGIFQRYVMEHPKFFASSAQAQGWKEVQKQFQKLRLHKKTEDGLNIWRCTVCGQKRTRKLQGYLLQDPTILFTVVPHDNPYLSLDAGDGSDADI